MSLKLDKYKTHGECYRVDICRENDNNICIDEADCGLFLSLFDKFLINNSSISLLAYCLNENFCSLLLIQKEKNGIEKFLHNLTIAYNNYYFDKYKISDLLFENNYKIAMVSIEEILEVSRSIHKIPENWKDCQNSSIRAYLYDDKPDWIDKTHIVSLNGSAKEYFKYMSD